MVVVAAVVVVGLSSFVEFVANVKPAMITTRIDFKKIIVEIFKLSFFLSQRRKNESYHRNDHRFFPFIYSTNKRKKTQEETILVSFFCHWEGVTTTKKLLLSFSFKLFVSSKKIFSNKETSFFLFFFVFAILIAGNLRCFFFCKDKKERQTRSRLFFVDDR